MCRSCCPTPEFTELRGFLRKSGEMMGWASWVLEASRQAEKTLALEPTHLQSFLSELLVKNTMSLPLQWLIRLDFCTRSTGAI